MDIDVKEIALEFGYELEDYEKIRSVYKCKTDKGVRGIKENDVDIDKIIFEYEVKNYLALNGFLNIDKQVLSEKTNLPYVTYKNKKYIMSEWIEGRECNLENEKEMKMAVSELALMHKASIGFRQYFDKRYKLIYEMIGKNKEVCEENIVENTDVKENNKVYVPRTDIAKLDVIYEKRKKELERIKSKLKKEISKTELEKLYISSSDLFIEEATIAIDRLKKSNYMKLAEETLKEGSFCHHDYAFHNIIIDNEGKFNVIDFEYATYELRVYDLANVIKRSMKRCNWDIKKACLMIETYDSTCKLTHDELEILFVMLIFPQKLWRIMNRYYNSKKLLSVEVSSAKLADEINLYPYHQKFMEDYEKLILNK